MNLPLNTNGSAICWAARNTVGNSMAAQQGSPPFSKARHNKHHVGRNFNQPLRERKEQYTHYYCPHGQRSNKKRQSVWDIAKEKIAKQDIGQEGERRSNHKKTEHG